MCLLTHAAHSSQLLLGAVYFSENSKKTVVVFPVPVNSDMRLKLLFVCRALEERLQGKPLSCAGLELEQVLLQLDVAQKKEQHLQSEVTRLENR